MHLRLRILCLCVSLCALGVGTAAAAKKGCSDEDSQKAEAATDNLKSWDSVYEFYRTYSHCDSGGVSEGVSDAVAKLLAHHWELFPAFVVMADNDKNFEKFVLRHVDATIDQEHDAPAIRDNAQHHCPSHLWRLCKSLQSRAVPPKEMGPR